MSNIHITDSAGGCAEALKGLIGGRRAFAIIDSALAGTAANSALAETAANSALAGTPADQEAEAGDGRQAPANGSQAPANGSQALAQAITGLFGENVIWLEAGEGIKTLECVEAMARTLLEKGVDREWLLVGIGGGITTDITGLLAAIYMRGIACGLVPTTLLAQADAAIGGKNGVNLDGGKNILGTFREPEFICICPELTQTLSRQDRLCGIAEILKAFILSGQWDSYRRAVTLWSNPGQPNPTTDANQPTPATSSTNQPTPATGTDPTTAEAEILREAIAIKQDIVSRDPLEKGERRLLNLGHTFGHAIEKCSGGAVPHGLAVAAGIILAAKASVSLGLLEGTRLSELQRDFASLGLPAGTDIAPEELTAAMRIDKKKDGDSIRFILPTDGKAVIKAMKPEEIKALIDTQGWD